MVKAKKTMTVLLASGASGGHLFPALAVAEVLRDKGVRCVFVLGGGKFGDKVTEAGFELVRLPAGAFNVRNPIRKLVAAMKLLWGLVVALKLVAREKPAVVLGTGGYASVATVLAAKCLGVPTLAHEQNVLPGRANRLLARVVDKLLLTFEESRNHIACSGGCEVVGMPLRQAVVAGVPAALQGRADEARFHLLVLGGSMGARILSDVVPEMVALMAPEERAKLVVMQQARPEDVDKVLAFYSKLGLAGVEVASFFGDLPQRYGRAHVVIGRSGTGTVLEVAAYGRAAIYCPHQMADGHQLLNAQVAEHAGAAVVMEQPIFTPTNLLVQVRKLWQDEGKRREMELSARTIGDHTGAHRVADVVLQAAKDDILGS